MIGKIKAIFFDMDGVLVQSEEQHYQAWLITLEKYTLSIPKNLNVEEYQGRSDAIIAKEIEQFNNVKFPENFLPSEKRKVFLNLLSDGLSVPKGRDTFLKEVKERLRLSVVTSSSREEMKLILTKEGIIDYFEHHIVSEDTKQHKPHPSPYQRALKLSGILPEEALVIEDSASGIEAAIQAGIFVIGLNSLT